MSARRMEPTARFVRPDVESQAGPRLGDLERDLAIPVTGSVRVSAVGTQILSGEEHVSNVTPKSLGREEMGTMGGKENSKTKRRI